MPEKSDYDMTTSYDIMEMLRGVVGVVEANSYEHLCLWREEQERRVPWKEGLAGRLVVVGRFNRMPVCLSIRVDEVGGHRLAFIDATSAVVDWRKIDAWLKANMPKTAFRSDGHINKVDAMNFHNVFPREAKAA